MGMSLNNKEIRELYKNNELCNEEKLNKFLKKLGTLNPVSRDEVLKLIEKDWIGLERSFALKIRDELAKVELTEYQKKVLDNAGTLICVTRIVISSPIFTISSKNLIDDFSFHRTVNGEITIRTDKTYNMKTRYGYEGYDIKVKDGNVMVKDLGVGTL